MTPREIERVVCTEVTVKPSELPGLPRRVAKELTGGLENIILMAMHKEPSRRYHSAEQFAQDLLHYLEGQPVLARLDAPWYRAAIAALHAEASTADQTDWAQIAALYEKLLEVNPTPVIELNRAVAVAMSGRLMDGLTRIDELGVSGALDRYHLFHAARADLLRRLNRNAEAMNAFQKAALLASNLIEVDFLNRRLRELLAT